MLSINCQRKAACIAPQTHVRSRRRVAAVALDRRPATHLQEALNLGLVAVDHEPTVTREDAQHLVKLPENRIHVGVDIRMVEFEVIDDQRARSVMHELGTLVEKRGVVLVGLDHEVLSGAKAGRCREICRHAADQEARLKSCCLQQPCRHASRRRLAVGAGYRNDPAISQHMFCKPGRAGGIGHTLVQYRLDDRHTAAHDVADDDEVGRKIQLPGIEAFDQVDAKAAQLIAHGRIHAAIATGHPVAGLAGNGGNSAHERPANTEDMNMHSAHLAPLGRKLINNDEINHGEQHTGTHRTIQRS